MKWGIKDTFKTYFQNIISDQLFGLFSKLPNKSSESPGEFFSIDGILIKNCFLKNSPNGILLIDERTWSNRTAKLLNKVHRLFMKHKSCGIQKSQLRLGWISSLQVHL
jgi:hypothetical protein